jgi:hypothetical protein
MKKFFIYCLLPITIIIAVAPRQEAAVLQELKLAATYQVPSFGEVSNILTDISYETASNRFHVCSEGGCGEFPYENGGINFGSPGFYSQTYDYILRGFAETNGGFSAIDNRKKIIFYGNSAKLPLPRGVGEISGMAFGNGRFWIAERSGNRIIELQLKDGQLWPTHVYPHPGQTIEGILWNQGLWTCDQDNIYRLNKTLTINTRYQTPNHISGFIFVGGAIFATAYDQNKVYKFIVP